MNAVLELELRAKTRWGRADVACLAQARPAVVAWRFAPGSVFEDGALEALRGAERLAAVAVHGSILSGRDLRALGALPRLRHLDLKGSRFAAPDFAVLCELLAAPRAKVTELWLEDTPVGDDALRWVGDITRLTYLILAGTAVSDAGLEHLHRLTKLRYLWLNRTQVTDAGVVGLAVLPLLSGVPVRATACSPEVKETLFRAQMRLQQSSRPADFAQLDAADAQLQAFLRQIEAWERSAWERSGSMAEYLSTPDFWGEINRQKGAIIEEFCTNALRRRGIVRAELCNNPPSLVAPTEPWVVAQTPARTRTVFVGFAGGNPLDRARRFVLKWEAGAWRVDDVQCWQGGWKGRRF